MGKMDRLQRRADRREQRAEGQYGGRIGRRQGRTERRETLAGEGALGSLKQARKEKEKQVISAMLDPNYGKADEAKIRQDKVDAGEAAYAALSGAMAGSDNPAAALDQGATIAQGAAAATAPLARSEETQRALAAKAANDADFAALEAQRVARVERWTNTGKGAVQGGATQE